MTFESGKTCQHLRAKALEEGAEGRMRALQALSHGYSGGSEASIAKMLLATLGGQPASAEITSLVADALSNNGGTAFSSVHQIAPPMQNSANDEHFQAIEANALS